MLCIHSLLSNLPYVSLVPTFSPQLSLPQPLKIFYISYHFSTTVLYIFTTMYHSIFLSSCVYLLLHLIILSLNFLTFKAIFNYFIYFSFTSYTTLLLIIKNCSLNYFFFCLNYNYASHLGTVTPHVFILNFSSGIGFITFFSVTSLLIYAGL